MGKKEDRYSINANPFDFTKYRDGSGSLKVTEIEDTETHKKVSGCGYTREEADQKAEREFRKKR